MAAQINLGFENENESTPECRKKKWSVDKLLKHPPYIMTTITTQVNYDDLILQSVNRNKFEEDVIESKVRPVTCSSATIDQGPEEVISKPTEEKSCRQECCISLGMVLQGCCRLVMYGLYLYDMISDVRVSLLFYERGHRWWGTLGLTFFGVSWLTQCALAYDKVTVDYVPTAVNTLYYGRLSDRRVARILFLFLPFIQVTWTTYELVFGKVNTSVAIHRKIAAYRVKLAEVMLEAFPQILLQLYVILVYTDVDRLQWLSLTNSLISISVGLANGFMFQEVKTEQAILLPGASWIPYKSAWLIIGIITVACRIYICALWGAVIGAAMIVIPLLLGLSIAIGIWGLRAYFPCKYWNRAGLRFGDRGGTFEEKAHIVVSWMGTLLGNGINGTGMVLSLLYLILSVIPLLYKYEWNLFTQLGFGIATVAAVANIITLVTSKGQEIGQRWVEGQYKFCKAGQIQWFNGKSRAAKEGEKYYSFRYY